MVKVGSESGEVEEDDNEAGATRGGRVVNGAINWDDKRGEETMNDFYYFTTPAPPPP